MISGTSCRRQWANWSACSAFSKYQPSGHTTHQTVCCWQPCLSGCCSSSLEWPAIGHSKNLCLLTYLVILVEHWLVINRWTNRHTMTAVACSPSATGDAVQILLALACSSIYVDDVACKHSTTGGGGQRQLGSRMDFEFLSVVGHSSQ